MTNVWDSRFEEILRSAVPRLADRPIEPGQDLRDAGLDSMGSVELLLQLESVYDILVPDEMLTIETFETPADLWRVVNAVLREKTPERQ
jgi:acyl carrier protein